MTYVIEFWGVQASGDKFNEKILSKSTKPKNWLPKMREQHPEIDFDNLTDFGYRVDTLQNK